MTVSHWGDSPVFMQAADLGGVPAVSFLVLAVNGGLADLWLRARGESTRRQALAAALTVAALLGGAWVYGRHRLASLPMTEGPRVLVVQSLATAAEKDGTARRLLAIAHGESPGDRGWDAARALLWRHRDLTALGLAGGPADLVCWSESVVISVLPQDAEFLAEVRGACAESRTPLILGALRITPEGRWHNSAFLWGPDGACLGVYDKARPAPFAEGIPTIGPAALWLPLARLIGRLPDRPTAAGPPGQEPLLLPTASGPCPFGAALCFDTYDPSLFRHWQERGCRFVSLLSFEGDFPPSVARMELALARFRAVEMRRSVVRCAEDGWSAVISPTGASVAESGKDLCALRARVPLCEAGSFYARHGDLFSGGMLVLTLAGLLAAIAWKSVD